MIKILDQVSGLVPLDVWSRAELFAARQLGKGTPVNRRTAEVACCAQLLGRAPRTVLDIGANVGSYADAVINRFPDCTLHAFEPSPVCAQRLRVKFAERRRHCVHEVALSSVTGTAELWSDRPGSGFASLTKRRLDHFGIDFSHSATVSTVRLDEFAPRHGIRDIDWVKLDVEGHELAVLEGMGELLESIALIQFEFGGCNIDSRTYFQDFWYFFTQRGFRLFRITPRGPALLDRYDEMHESFRTTNLIALR